METTWTLNTGDGHKIYGRLNRAGDSSSAIFIVHGLTGHMHGYPLKRAADYFESEYDVYRFNLYDGQDQGRSLTNCTIETHAEDLNAVLTNFAMNYDKIFLIGHSYGGPTIMTAKPERITACSLWDPSFDLSCIQQEFKENYTRHGDFYIVNWGTSYLIGKAMYEEAGRLNRQTCIDLARLFPHPVQVIHAGDGFYVEDDISYHSFGNEQNIREIVNGSAHCFHEGTSCDDLLTKTARWFKKF